MSPAFTSIFTKQQYTWLGAYWRERKTLIPIEQWEREVLAFARSLRAESKGFTAVRFLQACGYSRRLATRVAENLDG
jgi:hypothetical protein